LTTYRALIGVVNPRPIAWVTTVDEQGRGKWTPVFGPPGANL
jgi:hypothetical protein